MTSSEEYSTLQVISLVMFVVIFLIIVAFLIYWFCIKKNSLSPLKELKLQVAGEHTTHGAGGTFLNKLSQRLNNLGFFPQYQYDDISGVLLLFCPIVSRIKTDINAALSTYIDYKRIILVVLHHTHNSELTLVDSAMFVDQPNVILTVDLLFHENMGLLECESNEVSLKKVVDCLYYNI